MPLFTVRVPAAQLEAWRRAASSQGLTVSAFVRGCVEAQVGGVDDPVVTGSAAVPMGDVHDPGDPVPPRRGLARDCVQASYHWRIGPGERCRVCGGTA